QLLHDLVPAAKRLDLCLLLIGEKPFAKRAQPFLRDIRRNAVHGARKAFEDMAENAVELVEMALVLHEGGARKVVKIVDLLARDARVDRVEKGEIFFHADRDAGPLQLVEEVQKHEALLPFGPEGEPPAFGFG